MGYGGFSVRMVIHYIPKQGNPGQAWIYEAHPAGFEQLILFKLINIIARYCSTKMFTQAI